MPEGSSIGKLILLLACSSNLIHFQTVAVDAPHRKFEYKYSFKGPQLIQNNGAIPFWTHHGHAIASEDQIRITPSLRSRSGTVWNKNPINFNSWEIELWLRISGKSRVGADGMAIWYTEQPGTSGRVFGASDGWNGLMIVLDSFDNNSKNDNPMIAVIKNDGTQAYDHQNDGMHQILGSCRRDYRNKVYPIKIKIIYRNNNLLVLYDNGLTDFADYEICAKISDIDLPTNGYFGVSAATGGLADDHDVLKFLTYSLSDKRSKNNDELSDGKMDKTSQEKYDKQKADFEKRKKEQAERDGKTYNNGQEMDVSDLEIARIYEVTSAIFKHVQESHALLAEVRKYMVTASNTIGGSSSGKSGSSDVTKFDIQNLKTQSAETVKMIHELKNSLKYLEVNSGNNLAISSGASSSGLSTHHINMLSTTKVNTDNLSRSMSDVKQMMKDTNEVCKMLERRGTGSAQVTYSSEGEECATAMTMFIFTIFQVILIVGIMAWVQKSGVMSNKQKFF